MNLVLVLIGGIGGIILGLLIILFGTIIYDWLTLEEPRSHLIRSSEVQRIKEELEQEMKRQKCANGDKLKELE